MDSIDTEERQKFLNRCINGTVSSSVIYKRLHLAVPFTAQAKSLQSRISQLSVRFLSEAGKKDGDEMRNTILANCFEFVRLHVGRSGGYIDRIWYHSNDNPNLISASGAVRHWRCDVEEDRDQILYLLTAWFVLATGTRITGLRAHPRHEECNDLHRDPSPPRHTLIGSASMLVNPDCGNIRQLQDGSDSEKYPGDLPESPCVSPAEISSSPTGEFSFEAKRPITSLHESPRASDSANARSQTVDHTETKSKDGPIIKRKATDDSSPQKAAKQPRPLDPNKLGLIQNNLFDQLVKILSDEDVVDIGQMEQGPCCLVARVESAFTDEVKDQLAQKNISKDAFVYWIFLHRQVNEFRKGTDFNGPRRLWDDHVKQLNGFLSQGSARKAHNKMRPWRMRKASKGRWMDEETLTGRLVKFFSILAPIPGDAEFFQLGFAPYNRELLEWFV